MADAVLPTTPAEARIPLQGEPMSYIAALETRARCLASRKMGLIKDPDGDRLPDDLWRQCLPEARADLPLGPHYEAEDVVNDPRVLAVYTACDWSELGDDGKVWVAKIVQVAQERALSLPTSGDAALVDVEGLVAAYGMKLTAAMGCGLKDGAVWAHAEPEKATLLSAFATIIAQLDTARREVERLEKLADVPPDGLVGGNPSGVYDMNDILAAYRKGWKERAQLAPSTATRDEPAADLAASTMEVDRG